MKNHFLLFCLTACLSMLGSFAFGQGLTLPPSGGNQKASVTQHVGLATVTIAYSSPDVHTPNGTDRRGKIWGNTVPHGMNNLGFGTATESPWRAGANDNTIVTLSHDVTIQGKSLPAGTYGLHIITQEEGKDWTLIFSHNATAWGSYFYDKREDALRVNATPEKGPYTEWLTYNFEDRQPNSCVAAMQWEDVKLSFKIDVSNMNELYVKQIRKELQNSPGFNWQNWASAANFCANSNINLEEALDWAEKGVSDPSVGQKNFTTLSAKAAVLTAMKKTDEANVVMGEAIRLPGVPASQIHAYGRQLIIQGKKDAALKIFQYNVEANPGVWPVHLGLSRGYAAVGEYKKALKHAKIAQGNVPAGDTLNAGSVVKMIEKLEKGEDIN